ncbi:MAG: N-6 DNA methylase [Muribaculaceae bacterium]|nr:N-6 DNA methylase [Muribaculaceae bacterium]
MANNTEDIKWLYDKLRAKGYDIGSQQEFTSSLANQADRDWYYDKAVGMGLDVGSKEDFNSLFTPGSADAMQGEPAARKPAAGSADAQQGEPETLALKQTADATGKETGRAEAETASRGSGAEGQGGKPKWLIDAMARRAVAGAEAFVSNLETQKEKNRRMAESGTQKGRDRVKAGERLARMAGKPARVLGISSPLPPEETGGAKASMSGAGPTVAASPRPYGVKMVDGKVKTEWLLPDGTLTTDLAEADMAENVARKTRMAHEHEKNVQAAVKDAVERAVAADDERSREESEAYMRNPSNMVGGVNAELGHAARRARAGIGDLEKIAESAYESIPEEYRKELESSYRQYFREHPDALNGKRIEDAARDAVRSDCYREVHEVYVGRNMPSNNSEFFVRKMLELNPASVTLSGTVNPRGQAYADTDALSRYGEKHKGLSIGATVTGMAMDAWTYASGAISGLARNAFMRTAGKAMAKGAAGKVLSRPLAGRILGNVVGGGTNFMAYEAGKEAERQLYHGGYVNPETGETEGYSFEAVANSGVHGFGMGAVTGSITPLIGNVADKAVRAASSTGGKLALRGGELAVSKVLEGTIFAAPEIYSFHTMDDTSFDGLYARRFGYDGVKDEKERSEARRKARESLSWDSWGENLAMMTGFGASHLIQSAPKVIRGLRPFKPRVGQELTREQRIHNNRSFRERVNAQLDGSSSDMAFTKDEQDELKRKGYGELSDLFAYDPEYKSRKAPGTETATREQDGDYRGIGGLSRGVDYEPSPRHNQEWGTPEFDGYEAMERLMADKGVSEAVRAKAYHLLTGRMVPPSTVTGYNVEDNHDGSVNVNALNNEGGVVSTRRVRYMDKTDYDESTTGRTRWSEVPKVKAEIAKVERQVELNTIDIGEQYKAAEAERFNRQGALPENIRRLVKEETGVDVDEAIRKEPGKRTEAETKALRLYADKLFDRETEAGSADAQQEETKAEADRIYEDSRLLYGRFEQGDPEAQAEIDAILLRMTEAHELCEDAFGDEAEVYMAEIKENPWGIVNDPNLTQDRKDAALYYINAKAALDGVLDASNEAAADKRKMVRKEVERRTHRDFSVIFPATMKADDRQVYIITGYVVMFPDGSGVDVRNSSDSVIILDGSGEYKFTSPDQIMSVGEAIDPQIELQSAYENIDREQEAIFSAAMEEPAADAAGMETTSQGSAAEREEYDQGYEAATTDAREYADDRLGGEIERLRGNADTLTDFGRGWLEALEYEKQRRAMEAGSVDAQQEEPETSPENGSIGEGIPGKGNNDGEIIPGKGNNDGEIIPGNIPGDTSEGETAPSALERIPVDEQTGDPILTHESVDADTAWEAATEFFGTPEDALSYVQAAVNNAKSAITAAEKAVGKVKPTGGMSKYRDSLKAARGKVEAAKATLAKWEAIEEAQKRRKAEEAAARAAETAARNAQLHDEAVARFEEEQRIKAEKQAEQERIGIHAVNPKIKEKWDASTKVDGHPDAITLPDGSTLTGHYVMTEAGAASASHDVNNAFEPTEGFPIDKNGQSVNDRDYKRDMDAQQIVQNMADAYDSRAMQTPVIVSKDGIVLSGNNRTMSGDMAATQGTDGAYLEYLGKYGAKYGFTPEQVATMKHPRVVFVPDEDLPYDANTFSRFNAQEMKSQSKPEAAIKLGKIVDDATFNRIVADLNKYDRLSDFYADQEAAARTLGELVAAGVINDKQLPELRTGTALSATGKELIENTLIGKIFQSEPEAVRMIISMPTLKQSVIIGLNEIANNRTLSAKGYDLSNELSAAVDLVFRAKTTSPDIYKDGMPVSPFGRQQGLFDDEYGESRVTDATTLLLADLLNSAKPSDVRKVLSIYNQEAGKAAAGYMDMFNPDVRPYTKEEVLNTVNELFRNGTAKEKQELVDAAIADRKQRAAAEQAERGGSEATEQTADAGKRGEGSDGRGKNNSLGESGDRSLENFFGTIYTGFEGRGNEAEALLKETCEGVVKGALTYPGLSPIDLVWGDRKAGYMKILIKHPEVAGKLQELLNETTITNQSENRVVLESITHKFVVSKMKGSTPTDNWLLTAYEKKKKSVSASSSDIETEPEGKRNGTATPQNGLYGNMDQTAASQPHGHASDGKVNALSSEKQADLTESSENEGGSIASGGNGSATAHGSLGERIAEAEAQVNLYPTEAQKKAGNYSKGHVNVEGFDVTIEQPKGSVRRGKDANGNPWESKMNNTYGYILGTEGVDGDHIDVFLSDTPKEGNVYVVDQYEPDGTFDEHKVMYGFPDAEAARSAYLSNYEKGWEDIRRIDVTGVTKEDFKKWIQSSRRKTKPFADYKSIKAITEDVDQKRTNINKEGIVTDGEGKPLTLYHGTPNKEVTSVTMLEPGHKRMGEEAPARFNGDGVSFTPEMWAAQDYASEAGHGKGRIFPANIRLNNPYYTLGVANFTPEEAAEFTAGLKAKGHDGIINYASASMREIGALPNEVIVFDKSAILPIEDKNLDGFGYTITPTTYTRKKGKGGETPVWVVKFDRDLSYEEKRALVAYIKAPLADGKKTSRGWLDKESGQFYMRSEAAAKGLAAMLDNSEAVADAQPLSKEDFAEAAKPTAEEGLDYKTVDNAEDFMKAVHHDWGETAMVHPASHDTVLQFAERALINGRNRSSRQLGNALQNSAEFDLYPSEERMMKTAGFSRKQTALTLIDDKGKCVYDIVWHPNQNKGSRSYVSVTQTSFRPTKQKNAPMNRVDVEGLFNDLSTKGETNLSDHSAPVKPESAPAKPEPKRMVVDDEMRNMEDELRSLLGIDDSEGDRGDLFRDPEEFTNKERREITALGVTYALKYFDQGIVSFPDFADRMVRRMGEKIRPWLKAFYGGARDIPGYDHLPFTPADEVKAFDVMNFDREEKERGLDPMRTAQGIVAEARAEAAMAKAKKEITEQRNQKRKERDEQTTADTEAIAKQAETTASEAEATAESAVDEQSIAEASEKIDEALEKVNEQLALLGYYEAKRVDKDFNEAYGYMRNAEKKALADAVKLAKQLVKDLGIEIDKVTGSTTAKKSKKPTAVSANIAPAGGDISIRLPLNEGRELYVSISLDPSVERGDVTYSGDNLQATSIMYRVETPDASGYDRFGRNCWADASTTYSDLLKAIQRESYKYLPETNAEGKEYKSGDSIQYSADGGKSWTDGKVVEINDDGSLKLDTGLAPVLYVNATQEQVRHKGVAKAAPGKKELKQETPAETPESTTDKTIETPTGKKRPVRKTEVKPKQSVGDLFSGIYDEPEKPNKNEKGTYNAGGQELAGDERAHTVGTDETGTDGGVPSAGTEPTDKGGAADEKGAGVERGTDGATHGTDADGELQPRLGNRGRNEGDADSRSAGAAMERGGTTGEGSGSRGGAKRGGEGLSEGESSTVAGRGSGTPSVKKARKPEARYTRNFRYDEKEGNEADTYTPSQRLEANVKAIETLAEVLFGDKPATDEQKAIMSRFRGWGQVDLGKYYDIDHILRNTYSSNPLNRLAKAIQKLDPQGDKKLFDAIKRASLSSYYTPTPIARAMNTFLSLAGYRGGAMLDPSMGNGMYEGTLPKSIQERTAITGVELDWLSGQLSRMLYPDANVIIGGFEKSGIAPGSFDVVTSNVPFGDIVVNDPSWKNDSTPVKRSAQNRIHNYYAVKMLEATRPGGLVAMLTTSAVMDTPSNQNIRAHIADQGEILGAIRLPDNTFQGTGVVTDMIFIRKWRDDRDRAKTREDAAYKELEQAFLSHYETTAPNKLDGKKEKVQLNGYFEKNPRNLIGEIQAGNQYGKRDAFGLTSKLSVDEIASETEKAIKRIVGSRRGSIFNPTRTIREVQQAVREAYKGDGDWVSNGNLVIQDGKVGVLTAKSNEYGEVTRTFEGTLKHDKMLPRIKSMIEVRTAMKKLIAGQIEGSKELELMALRSELQKAYDNFVGKYGRLQDKDNSFILDDIDGYTIQALETWKNGKFVGLSDIFTKNSIKPALKLDGKKKPQEAVALSLAEYGYLRPDYLAKALGEDWAEQCGDFVFLKPNSEDDYVTRDEYLSGDVVTKLAEARSAAEKDKSFERNVKALDVQVNHIRASAYGGGHHQPDHYGFPHLQA